MVMPNQAVQPIKPAATVIIVREANSSFEIFMLKRTTSASFASGMFVFPGGKVDHDDHLHKYDVYRVGPTEKQSHQIASVGYEWRGFWIAAIRETFEESGLLLAYDQDGRIISFADKQMSEKFSLYRQPLHDGALTLIDICEQESISLAVDQVHFYNRFVTPIGRPRRFDTRFFIAAAPEAQRGVHDDQETVDSTWISPMDALKRNDAKEFDLMRVTRMQLEWLSKYPSKKDLLEFASKQKDFLIRRPGPVSPD